MEEVKIDMLEQIKKNSCTKVGRLRVGLGIGRVNIDPLKF
jgi:hypothetical protein